MTTFDDKAGSRDDGAPINLYIFRGSDQAESSLENLVLSVNLIPGTTEFGYGTTVVRKTDAPGLGENAFSGGIVSDFSRSIGQLLEVAPNLRHVSLVVAWHGDDLRIGNCKVKPKVEIALKPTIPYDWQVGPVTRGSADVVSYIGGNPAAGGAPSDRSIYEAVVALRAMGLAVTVYPFILMDIPSTNTLPNPYGGTGQPAYPWRGRMTCHPAAGEPGTVDMTAAAATQVSNFFGTVGASDFGWDAANKRVTYSGPAGEWSFRRHILHMATIAAEAGATDFLIGTEMVGMTSIRSARTVFPAVDQLISLLGQVRTILGSGPKVSYAADWSEYHSYRPQDGSNDIHFPLDPLWTDSRIDYVGIDNYLPISDWRVGTDHLDARQGWQTTYDLNYLRERMESGEDYDWFYASQAHRDSQTRTPILDGAFGEDWIYRQKDLRGWWGNQHRPRLSGVQQAATAWVAQGKKIVFTEFGCPAVNRGANQPNVFVDPKSSENSYPRYSLEVRDDLIQRAYLEATITYWSANNPASGVYSGRMLDLNLCSIWCWDARPFPDFPNAASFWGDAPNWETGHWLNGRLLKPTGLTGQSGEFRYTTSPRPVEYGGYTYEPVVVKPGKMRVEGNAAQNNLSIKLPRTNPLSEVFKSHRPAHPLTLTILQGHLTDGTGLFLPRWTGRIVGSKRKGEELELTGAPWTVALSRAGLRRNYQIGCPHVLYGEFCRASKAAATVVGTVTAVSGATITLAGGWEAHAKNKYITGFVEWDGYSGQIERRRIQGVSGNTLTLTGYVNDLVASETVSVILGCNQSVNDCRDLHNNIDNCGACPTIPTKNPMGSNTNNFY